MIPIDFCNTAGAPLARALGFLLEPLVGAGERAVILAGSPERLEALNTGLWTYTPASFLPHGSAADGNAERQPVWLTVREENPNRATLLVLVEDMEPASFDGFARCLFMFDRSDPQARDAARERWRFWRDAGHPLRLREFGPDGWGAG